jgi:glycosyl hydrolase family 16
MAARAPQDRREDAPSGRSAASHRQSDPGHRRAAHVVVSAVLLVSTQLPGMAPASLGHLDSSPPTAPSVVSAPSVAATTVPTAPTATATPTPRPSPGLLPSPAPLASEPEPSPPSREQTFAAEFAGGTGPFAYDDGWGCGFGEQSDFMGDLRQVAVADGVATIRAERSRTPCGREFATAIMSTRDSFSQLYGYFEARIRFDSGNGLWPAFWMQPADGSWPPEIDILEAYPNTNGAGPGLTQYMSSLHYGADNQVIDLVTDVGRDFGATWHTYGLDWRPGTLTFYFDGRAVGAITENVPDKAMIVIVNLAVGNWSALADSATPDGAAMAIDWVRAYR